MALAFGGQGPNSQKAHRPVLLRETIESLAVERGGLFVDCTVGLGGHSEAILQASSDAQVLGIDRDEEALELARERLAEFGGRFRAVRADFRELTRVLATAEVKAVRGILADLGVSSLQLDSPSRGFSFRHEAPLDMRMDMSSGETAAELLGRLSEVEIARLIFEYGEERHSRRIARRIVERRDSRRADNARPRNSRSWSNAQSEVKNGGSTLPRARFKRCASQSIASSKASTNS